MAVTVLQHPSQANRSEYVKVIRKLQKKESRVTLRTIISLLTRKSAVQFKQHSLLPALSSENKVSHYLCVSGQNPLHTAYHDLDTEKAAF